MKAAVWHGYKDVRIEEVKQPETPSGSVKIRVDYAGICGTDRHEYVGPNFIPTKKPHRLTGRMAPLIIGHEFSGVITEVGEGVTGYRTGDRVTANGTLCCKECAACKSGRYNVCEKLGFKGVGDDGTFAEYVTFEAARLFKIPDNVTQRQALLAEPLACGIHATRLVGDIAGKSVVVIGPGIIGLACFLAAKLAGAGRVLVAGLGTERKELVESYGGEYLDTGSKPVDEYVKELLDGQLAEVVYECVGIQPTLDNALHIVRPGGKIMVMGVYEKQPVIDMNLLQEGERVLLTSQAHLDEIGVALDYMSKGRINADELITREVTLDTLVEDGFEELLRNPSKHIKIAIKIG